MTKKAQIVWNEKDHQQAFYAFLVWFSKDISNTTKANPIQIIFYSQPQIAISKWY
jgi:hypothetical protein